MMPEPRYAIYLAPPSCTPIWQFGSKVLGHDAASGQDVDGFSLDGIDAPTWRRITMRPRVYGFHATLKAPFRLADGCARGDLQRALSDFAASCTAFDLGPLAATSIADDGGHGFVALTLTQPSPALEQLETDVVHTFDRFRAPLTEVERAKRKPLQLTPRQRQALDRFGYPHVGPDYRFHMTLTGNVANADDIADKLADAMANEIGTAHLRVDALVLFEQAPNTENFRIIQRAMLSSSGNDRD